MRTDHRTYKTLQNLDLSINIFCNFNNKLTYQFQDEH